MSEEFIFVDGPSLAFENPSMLWYPNDLMLSLGDDDELGRHWLQLDADPPYRYRFMEWFEPVHDLGQQL